MNISEIKATCAEAVTETARQAVSLLSSLDGSCGHPHHAMRPTDRNDWAAINRGMGFVRHVLTATTAGQMQDLTVTLLKAMKARPGMSNDITLSATRRDEITQAIVVIMATEHILAIHFELCAHPDFDHDASVHYDRILAQIELEAAEFKSRALHGSEVKLSQEKEKQYDEILKNFNPEAWQVN